MKKGISKGFTLIELLVVIAIIGILASIVLVSLNSARQKGKDTRVLSDVNQVRTQIETEASSAGIYQVATGDCVTANPSAANGNATVNSTVTTVCGQLSSDATANVPSSATTLTVRTDTAVGTSATTFKSYLVYAQVSNGYYCVDSTGKAGTLPAAPAAGITCQ